MSEFDYTYNWPPAYVDIFLVHGSPANSETSTDHDWSDVNSDTNSDIDSDTDSVGVSSDEYLDGERYGDYVKLRLRNGGCRAFPRDRDRSRSPPADRVNCHRRQRFASPPSREPSPCRGSSGSRSRSRSPERPGTVVEESIAERISRYRSREDVTREERGRPRSKSWPGSVPSREFVHPNAMSTPEEPEKSEQQKHTPAEGELVGKEAKLCAKQQAESSSGDCAELEMEDMHQPIGPTAGKSSERETQDSAGPYAGISSPNFNWPKAYEATLRPENKFRTVHAGRRLTPRSSELLRNQNAIAFQQVSVRFNAGWRAPESWHIQLAYQYGTPVYFTMAIDSPAAAFVTFATHKEAAECISKCLFAEWSPIIVVEGERQEGDMPHGRQICGLEASGGCWRKSIAYCERWMEYIQDAPQWDQETALFWPAIDWSCL